MKVGNIELSGVVFLAPMAGVTNLAYREFMKPFGVALTYSEMISDCGLIYGNKETYKYLDTSAYERPVALQIFGGSKETLLKALEIIENQKDDYDFIDVNLGCPVPKVTKTGAGSAWLKREDELFDMMSGLVKASKKPVTAKIRIGWDEQSINVERIVTILQDAGVSLIAIHPRTRNQLYSGVANYERIKDIKKLLHIPLVISGDIFTLESAIEAQKLTNADGIMVARGAMGNPYLITQIKEYLSTGTILPSPDINQQMDYLLEHYNALEALKGERVAIMEFRGIGSWYLKGFKGAKEFKVMFSLMKNKEDLLNIITQIKDNKLERI